jgi:hypothetical protein
LKKLYLTLAATLILSCHTTKETANPVKENLDSPIERILAEKSSNQKNIYVLEGIYQGYSGKDCTFPSEVANHSPITRSDWIFSDGKVCIYVSAREQVRLHPFSDRGKKIKIKVKTAQTSEGKIYFQLISIN